MFKILIAFMVVLTFVDAAQQTNTSGEQTVYTMRGEYEIKPQTGKTTYLLSRFAKDGTAFDVRVLTKTSEQNGETVYVDKGGKKYTTLPDGRLQEKIVFDSTPAVPITTGSNDAAAPPHFLLMSAPPVVPRSAGNGLILASNLTLPKGDNPLRTQGSLLLLTVGKDDKGNRHEVAVQKVSADWYIRISADREDVAPAFRLEEDGSVSGFRELPPGVPQVGISQASGPQVSPVPPPPPVVLPAPVTSNVDGTMVEFQGHKGTIVTRSDATGQHFYLTFEGEPGSLELESVRGLHTLFTPAGRADLNVIVDSRGKLTVRNMAGQEVALRDLMAGAPPAVGRPLLTRTAEPQNVPTPAPAQATRYSGPSSGKLECEGPAIPQNGEHVFNDLPPVKLQLDYDTNAWEGVLVPNGQTQRLILRNKKPGTQKKCTVKWTVAP